ncbi:hypothetical protein [Muribaculum intestinale]|uniref:XRE family transcriptional regulator n=1 Tax=Muribaculum intestinale TaxID=1796646 RepID=A0A4S2FXP6_9BACT|nr:hypothetical protein [Muribaculum intestinale]MYM12425.1 hypothetical protein [Muribaculum intestinale]RXE74671.1 hypothetical protein ED551_02230 [Muribaculaceae bacterium Isolate-013 (NCI)]TGY74213.1 hypothetical protein E5333_07245 [Muribaculum intestinale]
MAKQMTFKDLYLREKEKPTPAQSFIEDIAELTKRSANTVRMWLQGKQTPDALAQSLIAEKFDIDVSTLFPEN